MRKTAHAAPLKISRAPLYQALLEVNLHFDHIREHIEKLHTLTLFRSRAGRAFLPAFDDSVSDPRLFNTELLEAQGEVESREWARLDLLRARREKSFREGSSLRPGPKPGAFAKRKPSRRKRRKGLLACCSNEIPSADHSGRDRSRFGDWRVCWLGG